MAKAIALTLLTYDEAAVLLRSNHRKVRDLVAKGVLGRTMQGRKACVFSDELDVYIDGLARGNGETAVRAYRVRQGRIKR